MAVEHFDVIIVGAGLSGVGAAVHLHEKCPGKSYVILEGRPSMGGTWDLFRYPGIRSDSDMHTLGYSFKPWREAKAIADGPSILQLRQGDRRRVRRRRAHPLPAPGDEGARWSSADATWTVEALRKDSGDTVRFTCNFLFMCSGYYSYRQGYTPEFEGIERFKGTIVHPQQWPRGPGLQGQAGGRHRLRRDGDDARAGDGEGRRPHRHAAALADLCRVASRQGRDRQRACARCCPSDWAYAITRWKNVALQQFLYRRTRTHPDKVKQKLLDMVRKELGPDYDVETHFTPSYNPWDQRLCLVPNSDLFAAIRSGKASIVTDHIERFTETGIALAVRQAARRRHHRHGDRPQPRRARRDAVRRRRRAGRFRADLDLQGHDVFRRAEPGLHVRLHQRLVDAARGPHLRIRLPAHQPHGRDRHAPGDAAPARQRTRTCRRAPGSTSSRPATCSA